MSRTVQALAVHDADFDEVTATSTTSATLEDVAGLTFDLVLTAPGRITAIMSWEAYSDLGAGNVGAWAVSIGGVDGSELQRYLSGTNDKGIGAVQSSRDLPAGTYTIKGRHRRVSGVGTIHETTAQLSAYLLGG